MSNISQTAWVIGDSSDNACALITVLNCLNHTFKQSFQIEPLYFELRILLDQRSREIVAEVDVVGEHQQIHV